MELRDQILTQFSAHLREHGKQPESVFRFCKALDIPERAFYEHFASFDTVESAYWADTVNTAARETQASPEWAPYGARQRTLAFLFAFQNQILEHRSAFLSRFKCLGPIRRPEWTKGMEAAFRSFIQPVLDSAIASGEIPRRAKLESAYPEALYMLFRSAIDFSLKDESARFERTDAFVEKSVKLCFDLIGVQALDSALDLARFLLPHTAKA